MSAAHRGARSMRSRWPVSGTTWTVVLGRRAPRMRALTGWDDGVVGAAEDATAPADEALSFGSRAVHTRVSCIAQRLLSKVCRVFVDA